MTSLDVTGPSSVGELADAVAGILNQPIADRQPTYVEVGPAVLVRAYEPDDPVEAAFSVAFYTGKHASGQSRQVFDALANQTGWALELLDDGMSVTARRPAVSQAN